MPIKNLNKKIDKGNINDQEIAEEIIADLRKKTKNIIIFLQTYELDQVKDLDEFVRYISKPLIQQLKELKANLFKPKIVFVWLDLASCPTSSTVELFQNEIPIVSHFSKTDVINWIEEQKIITKMSKWRKRSNFPEDPEQFLEIIWGEVDVIISDMIKPEIVLEVFYKFTLNQWEEYRNQWLKL
jgi:23S rRNA U2552 (ribose-2'-O)-methylase RlmE/FtsJ